MLIGPKDMLPDKTTFTGSEKSRAKTLFLHA